MMNSLSAKNQALSLYCARAALSRDKRRRAAADAAKAVRRRADGGQL